MVTNLDQEREICDIFAIDEHGKPTTYLSFLILELMFCEPQRWFTTVELARLLAFKFSDVESICRQLKQVDFLVESTKVPNQYQYNLNCRNVDLQTGFESFLIDVQLESLPIHLILDYSPSFHSRV